MHRVVLLAALALPLMAGSGAAQPAEKLDLKQISVGDASSRILVSEDYGDTTTISGSVDFERDVGILKWTFSGDSTGGKAIYTRDLMFSEAGSGRWELWGRCEFDGGALGQSVLSQAVWVFGPQSGPAELLGFLKRTGNFEKLGTGAERGVSVTRYKVTVDVERILNEVPRSARKREAEDLHYSWPNSQNAGIPVDVSVDSQGRLRRMNVKLRVDGSGIDGDGLLDQTVEFFDYGVQVDAKAPRATDEIVPRGDPYLCAGKTSD